MGRAHPRGGHPRVDLRPLPPELVHLVERQPVVQRRPVEQEPRERAEGEPEEHLLQRERLRGVEQRRRLTPVVTVSVVERVQVPRG